MAVLEVGVPARQPRGSIRRSCTQTRESQVRDPAGGLVSPLSSNDVFNAVPYRLSHRSDVINGALRSISTSYDNITEVIVIKSLVAIFVQAVGEPSEPRMHFQVRASDLPSPPFFVDLTICHILCSRLTLGQMSDCEAHGLVTGGAKGRRSKVSVLLSRGNTGSP